MKKVANVFEEKAESLETSTKRITKNVSENVHAVDSLISSARSSSSLFSVQAISARIRLRDTCERAIISGTASFTQKMDEILWRKVYYDPLSAAKKMKKGSSWTDLERGLIWAHLNDGIAYYHHRLVTLYASNNCVQYTADLLPSHFQGFADDFESSGKCESVPSLRDSFFRSLTCLGDLARYMLDIPNQISNCSAYLLSVRYYHQALHHNCEGGLTHSNLATVYSTNNQPLLAAVHYLRATTCEKPFEAAENNLRRMLDKSRMWLENKKIEEDPVVKTTTTEDGKFGRESTRFLHTCLSLLSCFINNRNMEEIVTLCQDVLVQLGKLLDDYDNIEPPDLSETSSSNDPSLVSNFKNLNGCCVVDSPLLPKLLTESVSKKQSEEEYGSQFLLTPESMVTLCALFIICAKRLKMQSSPHSNMSEVLVVSILVTLVSHINTRLEQRFSLADPTFAQKLLTAPEKVAKNEENDNQHDNSKLCNGDKSKKAGQGKRNKLSKLRRKRNKEIGLQPHYDEDSENEGIDCDDTLSDSHNDVELTSSSDEAEGDDNDDFDRTVLCASEEEESDDDVKIESEEEWEGITSQEHLDMIEQEGMLAALNVTLQWFFKNDEITKSFGKTTHFWPSLAKLFNLVNIDYEKLNFTDQNKDILKRLRDTKIEAYSDDESFASLPENLMLHLVIPSFHCSNSTLSLKLSEMNLLRLYLLNSIMLQLCNRGDIPLKLEENKFISCEENVKLEKEKNFEGRSTTPLNQGQQNAVSTKSDENCSPSTGVTPKGEYLPIKQGDTPSSSPRGTPKLQHQLQRCSPISVSNKTASSMQTLTAQWLQHEVRNLEEKTNKRMKLGMYVVPDASVLINHLAVVKQMLATLSYMIIIPQVVIDSLDQQKRESLGSRDAIRWLEVKLRNGCRFMRVQRPHEKSHLPLIKYPKRKDKEAWEWFHLAECCYYLGAQMNKTNSKSSTVTLLTSECSSKMSKRTFSLQTLAEAAGAVLESVDEFVRKWQTSTKGHS